MTVAAEIAHLCGDTPTAQESVLSPASLIQYVRDNGGFVHPDLQLLVGDEAEHGQVSLAGVDHDVLSLRVPTSLAEGLRDRGPWLEFVESLGAKVDAAYIASREFRHGVMPLASAANHNNGLHEPTGRVIDGHDFLELYGTEFCYGCDANQLRQVFGIVE